MMARRAPSGFKGAAMSSDGLRQHLNGDIVRHQVLLDDFAHEIEIGLRGRGNPTSISLKPIFTSMSNMRRLRAPSMGSISAWFPSRRSTLHQSRRRMTRLGQVYPGGRWGKGAYLVDGLRNMLLSHSRYARQLKRLPFGGAFEGLFRSCKRRRWRGVWPSASRLREAA